MDIPLRVVPQGQGPVDLGRGVAVFSGFLDQGGHFHVRGLLKPFGFHVAGIEMFVADHAVGSGIAARADGGVDGVGVAGVGGEIAPDNGGVCQPLPHVRHPSDDLYILRHH